MKDAQRFKITLSLSNYWWCNARCKRKTLGCIFGL